MKTKKHTIKAWAIVNDETGRLMLINVGDRTFTKDYVRMEAPAIYMTKIAAKHHARSDERIIRITITES